MTAESFTKYFQVNHFVHVKIVQKEIFIHKRIIPVPFKEWNLNVDANICQIKYGC